MSQIRPSVSDRQRVAIAPPRPLWAAVGTAFFSLAVIGLRIGGPSWQQRMAVRDVEYFGGVVHTRRAGPEWLTQWVVWDIGGVFNDVVDVQFRPNAATFDTRFCRTGLEWRGALPCVSGPTVDDERIACIEKLRKLERLDVRWTNIGDGGIERVRQLTNLESLDLAATDVSDAGLELLAPLTQMKRLSLAHTQVTDAGLEHLC